MKPVYFFFVIAGLVVPAARLASQTRLGTDIEAPPQRLALLIGNSAYRPLGTLKNPQNDVDKLAGKLKSLGFNTTTKYNLNRADFVDALSSFANTIAPGDIALFYYSGHGFQLAGQDYLVPVDMPAINGSQVGLQGHAVALELVKESLSAARLSIIVLDACRSIPNLTQKGTANGFAAYFARGSLVAFAADEGQSASDNDSESLSLFTKFLVAELDKQNENLCELFEEVRTEVDKASQHDQFPFVYDGVIGDFVFNRTTTTKAAELGDALKSVGRGKVWNTIEGSNDPNDFAAFLAPGIGDKKHEKLAESRLLSLMASTIKAAGVTAIYASDMSTETIAHANQGERLFYEGAYRKSLDVYEQLLKEMPDNALLVYNIGTCLLQLGKYDEAQKMLSSAIDIKPDFPWSVFNRGVAYHLNNDLKQATADYDAALASRPLYALGYNNLAIAKRESGDMPGAAIDAEKAIRLSGSFAPAYFDSAVILDTLGNASAAEASQRRGTALTIPGCTGPDCIA